MILMGHWHFVSAVQSLFAVSKEMEEIRLRKGDEESFIDKFLGDDSIQSLCDGLRRNPKQRLNLRGDRVTSSGAKHLADLLRVQHSLESIVLEWNELGSTGATFIAESLKANHSLHQINLQNNKIGSDGAISFAEAMEDNRTLSLLDLRWNKVRSYLRLSPLRHTLCSRLSLH